MRCTKQINTVEDFAGPRNSRDKVTSSSGCGASRVEETGVGKLSLIGKVVTAGKVKLES